MLITDSAEHQRARHLDALTDSAVTLLQVRPDHVHLSVNGIDPETRARHGRWAEIAQTSWTGC